VEITTRATRDLRDEQEGRSKDKILLHQRKRSGGSKGEKLAGKTGIAPRLMKVLFHQEWDANLRLIDRVRERVGIGDTRAAMAKGNMEEARWSQLSTQS